MSTRTGKVQGRHGVGPGPHLCLLMAACILFISTAIPSGAQPLNGPSLETTALLGQTYGYSPAMVVTRGGQVVAAWSTKSGQAFVVRMNSRLSRATLLSDIPGYVVAMAR